jgi:serine/threonine-protein kinase
MPEVHVHSSKRQLEAYTRYLRARFLIHQQSPEALRTAVQQLRELIQLFPDYAPAYSGLAAANGLLCLFGEVLGRDLYPELKANAERGYALEPDSGETCTVLGGLRGWFEYRWDEANRLYERALKVQPGHAGAHMFSAMALLCQGNIEAAEADLRRSTELDPLSASDCARMAYLCYVKGDSGAAAEQLKKSFELDRNYAEARFYDGLVRFRQEDFDGVIQSISDSDFPLHAGLMAAAYARKGSHARARKCVEEMSRTASRKYVTPLAYAFAATGMGDRDLAFKRLEEAIEHQTNFANMLAVDPFFEPLRDDSRFSRLLKTLNLSR